ncbi:unnamed protein product [Lactuca saligna]|uniref:Uncharacterized protein n=1 Tax=Lactuca saligna TaxID=75948 RepID=A0AA35YW29_LACSI|nr:unnamed protein product [Lactuca saligna]
MVYTKHGNTRLHTYFMSPNKVTLDKINEPISPKPNRNFFTSTEVGSCSRKLDLNENYDFSRSIVAFGHFVGYVVKDVGVKVAYEKLNKVQDVSVQAIGEKLGIPIDTLSKDFDPFFYTYHNDYQLVEEKDLEYWGDRVVHNEEIRDVISDESSTDGSISEDSDFLVDQLNMVKDVEVYMKGFHSGVENFPNLDNHQSFNVPDVIVDEDLEVIDTQLFESAGVQEDERNKLIRSLNKPTTCSSGVVHETAFHMSQIFKSKTEVKAYIKCIQFKLGQTFTLKKKMIKKIREKCRGVVLEMRGRAHTYMLLNNLCEVFNSKLLDAQDKPITTCL